MPVNSNPPSSMCRTLFSNPNLIHENHQRRILPTLTTILILTPT
jgi:hypothetical protein